MELFSKRYNPRRVRRISLREALDEGELISNTIRKRLEEELRYVTGSSKFLESFMLVHNKVKNKYYLRPEALSEFSLRELGYDLSRLVQYEKYCFEGEDYSDVKCFDLLELVFIFSKEDVRKELVQRFQSIFDEEGASYIIHEHMIFAKDSTGLVSITPLIKAALLKSKLEEYYDTRSVKTSYEAKARLSADILQYVFSSPSSKKNTKKYSSDLCKTISKKWTDGKHVNELDGMLNKIVLNAKELSNQIGNVRHVDQHTIPVDSPNFYKLIAQINMAVVELVILSLPDKYVAKQNPRELKDSYLGKYGIDKAEEWVVEPKEKTMDVPFDDVPF